MPFAGTSSNVGAIRAGAAHTARELDGTLAAGSVTILGPVRTIGMQRAVLVIYQATPGPVIVASIQYRVGLAWRDLVVGIPATVGQPVSIPVILPGARQVRALITAPGAGPVVATATLGALQGS